MNKVFKRFAVVIVSSYCVYNLYEKTFYLKENKRNVFMPRYVYSGNKLDHQL